MRNFCKSETILSAFADNELSSRRAEKVHKHLQICPDCRKKLGEIEELNSLLSTLPDGEFSPDFERSFWRKIDAEDSRQAERRPRNLGWRPILAGGLAAGLVAGLFFGVFEYRSHQSLSQEEIFMAENMELLNDFEPIRNLDFLEYWEATGAGEDHI